MTFRNDYIHSLSGQVVTNKSDADLRSIFAEVLNKGMHGLCFSPYLEDQEPGSLITEKQIQKLIQLANKYPNIIFSLSAGNEATVYWTDHYVSVEEAGWATNSNGRGINPENVSQEFQAIYYNDLVNWSEKEGVMACVFEAFDEPCKGSPEALEPEKHWGLFTVDRKPKKVFQ